MLDLESKFAKLILDLRRIRPFYAALYESIDKIEDESVETICVTSSKMKYNPNFLDTLEYSELIFVILHELTHIALKHPVRVAGRDSLIYNIACDLYVNKLLEEEFKSNIKAVYNSKFYIQMPKQRVYSEEIDTNNDCVESIYNELLNNPSNENSSEVEFRGIVIDKNTIENHLLDDGLDNAEQDNNLNRILSNAVTKMDMQCNNSIEIGGQAETSLEMQVRETLKSKLDWRKLLRKYCRTCTQPDMGFGRPDKRMLCHNAIYPGNTPVEYSELNNIKVCIDTSGSISDTDLKYILGQIKDILKYYKMEFDTICWDTMVQVAYTATDVYTIMKKGLSGRGGTQPSCIFEYLDECKQESELVLVFTDGYFNFSNFKSEWNKKYKNTIWVMTREYKKGFKPPFGKLAIAKFL